MTLRRALPSISEESVPPRPRPLAAYHRAFLLYRLSFVTGKQELEPAQQLVDPEIQADMLESPITSEPGQALSISTAPGDSAIAATMSTESHLAPIPEEDPEADAGPDTYLLLGCCPVYSLQTCRRMVKHWIRTQCMSIPFMLRN